MNQRDLLLHQAIEELLTVLPIDNTTFSYLDLKKNTSFQKVIQTLFIVGMKTPISFELKIFLQKSIRNLQTHNLFSNRHMLQSLEDLNRVLLMISNQLDDNSLPQKVKLQGLLQELQIFCLSYATLLSQETPSTFTAYVTNAQDNNVSVIDTSTNTVKSPPISVGTKPTDIALTPDGKFAYVTNMNSSNVSVIDTSTNTVIHTILLNTNPGYIAIHPNGKIAYVANINDTTVSVLDLTNNRLDSTFPGAPNPEGIALTPDSKSLYILSRDNLPNQNNNVWVFDSSLYTPSGKIPVGILPSGIAFLTTAALAYITNSQSNTVTIINSDFNSVMKTIPLTDASYGIAITPDGKFAYITNMNSNTVSVLDTSTNTVKSNPIPVGTKPMALAITPDGKSVYVVNRGDNTLSVIQTSDNDNTVIPLTIPVGGIPSSIVIK
ncbi:TPA: beta-propeller fold lactonase family protein [Bacillus cereus]|nr:beta-propeller fold lactonase family protein [Bacillus cereus]HDR3914370.1 beta-propeller fold lactonase family protein [Bacillus cereus]HDV7172591.1 beta-propeller fold lactonase family protein [Bacillus cereus]